MNWPAAVLEPRKRLLQGLYGAERERMGPIKVNETGASGPNGQKVLFEHAGNVEIRWHARGPTNRLPPETAYGYS